MTIIWATLLEDPAMNKLLILLSILVVAAGCNQTSLSTDSSGIKSGSEAWEAALNAKDIDAIVDLYTSDARVLAPNSEMTTGSAGIRSAFGAMIDGGLSVDLTSIDAKVSGDMGHNVGTYVLTANGEVADVGKFVETWQRGTDGKWRIANDIYNSDRPAAAPESSMAHKHVMIWHEVADGDKWMDAWRGENSRHKLFADNGAMHVHTFRSPDDPNLTGLVIAVHDMDALNAMLQSEEGQATAMSDGVKMDTLKMLVESE